MKPHVLVLAAVLVAGTALAQTPNGAPPGPPPDHSPAQHMDRLATLLDLTDAQKTQVQAVLEEEHTKMKALFDQARASGTRPSFEEMHATHEQLKQETLQKLSSVLNASQLKKFEILMEDHQPGPGHFHHGPPPGGPPSPPSDGPSN
jgi:Spy/CpxP family protein refolding chaperone